MPTDDQLNVQITGDASSAEAAYASIVSKGAELAASVTSAGVAGESAGSKIATSAKQAGDALDQAGTHAKSFGAEVEQGAEQGIYALRALGEQAAGLREALLSLAGPVTAIFAIGEAFKSAVEQASDAQSTFATLDAILKNQGVSVSEAREEIEKYATSLAENSKFSADAFIDGVKQMLTQNVSLNSALASQAAAADLATARNMTLADAERVLADAHNGRTRALVELGLATKAEIANGISYQSVIDRIEKAMGGSAAGAINTFAGASAQAQNAINELLKSIGNDFLPVLVAAEHQITATADALKAIVDGTSPLTPAFNDVGAAFATVLTAVEDFAESGPGVVLIFGGLTIAAGQLGVALATDLVASIGTLVASMTGPLIAAFSEVAVYTTETLIPSLVRIAVTIDAVVLPAIATLGGSLLADLVPAVTAIASIAIPAILGALSEFGVSVAIAGGGVEGLMAVLGTALGPIALLVAAVAGLAIAVATHMKEVE
jgi:hypothetical protein